MNILAALGVLTFTLSPIGSPTDPPTDADLATRANTAITFLTTQLTPDNPDPHNGAGYTGNRETLYGASWKDIDHNGCDTRNDILARDLTSLDYSPKEGIQTVDHGIGEGVSSCKDATIYAGTLHDPYTGRTISFHRGTLTSSEIQIDHIIPLGYAYRHGGWEIAQDGRKDVMEQFANDPLNLVAVDGHINTTKSDAGPADWMPPNNDYACEYAIRMSDVLEKYNPLGFTLADKDKQALITTLTTQCPTLPSTTEEPTRKPGSNTSASNTQPSPTVTSTGELILGDTTAGMLLQRPNLDNCADQRPTIGLYVTDRDHPFPEDAVTNILSSLYDQLHDQHLTGNVNVTSYPSKDALKQANPNLPSLPSSTVIDQAQELILVSMNIHHPECATPATPATPATQSKPEASLSSTGTSLWPLGVTALSLAALGTVAASVRKHA